MTVPGEVVTLHVVDGALAPEHWVYAVVGDDGHVLHVGCTRVPLAVRTWLHLTSDDPVTGRLRAEVPATGLARATVVGVRLPPEVDRAAVREQARQLLTWRELTRTEPAACPLPAAAGPAGGWAAALVAAVERADGRPQDGARP